MDEKSIRRITRYFDEVSLVGQNQSSAIFIPHNSEFDVVQNRQREQSMYAQLRLLDGSVGRLEACVFGEGSRYVFVVRASKANDPDIFRQKVMQVAGSFAPSSFLLTPPRKPIERVCVSVGGECVSDHLNASVVPSCALVGWLDDLGDVANVKVREMTDAPYGWMTRLGLSQLAKRDWRIDWSEDA